MADRATQGVIRWETPPPAGGDQTGTRQRPWALVAAQLRDRPGQWALIDDHGGNVTLATRIGNGTSWWKPAGAFEATTRMINGRLHVYARYIGPQGQ